MKYRENRVYILGEKIPPNVLLEINKTDKMLLEFKNRTENAN